jgi:hypothetical protein
MIDHDLIKQLIAALDAAVPKDGAAVKVVQTGGGLDESQLLATQSGFLRLGIELLKAAYASAGRVGPDVDLKYLVDQDGDFLFNWLEKVEEMPSARTVRRGACMTALLLGCGVVIITGGVLWRLI